MTFEAGPVIPKPEDKQGQKAQMQAGSAWEGRAFKHRCSNSPVWGLQELHPNGAWEKQMPSVMLTWAHLPHWKHLDWTSLIKSKALCPALLGLVDEGR